MICGTRDFSRLYRHILTLDQTRQTFDRWLNLPISLAGQINIVRISILPKFLFLFQCLPVFITKAFFKKLDTLLSQFIWKKNNSWIKKSFLQRPKSLGRMALPNFRLYYWSCNIRSLSFWCNMQGADWVEMKSNSSLLTSLQAVIYSSLKTPLQKSRI